MYLCNHVVNRIPVHLLRRHIYKSFYGYRLERNSAVLMGVRFYGANKFELGQRSVVNDCCRLDNRAGIFIGADVSISSEVAIITADHDVQDINFAGRLKPVVIGDYAFIGIRATILPGVSIGAGAVVAASSLVAKDVPPFAIVAGIPAKIIGWRNKELCYKLDYRPYFQ